MIKVLNGREKISALHHRWAGRPQHLLACEDEEHFSGFYTSMYLIQDTAESIRYHMEKGFSPEPYLAYIEFWGVMQAIIIQQDAIQELYTVVMGKALNTNKMAGWREIRDVRNQCAGHPARRDRKTPMTRTFMGRSFGDYKAIQYELWANQNVSHPTFDFLSMIDRYDHEAAHPLSEICARIRERMSSGPQLYNQAR